MSATYPELLVEIRPKVIDTWEEYQVIHARYGDLFRKKKRTRQEEELKRLLGLLIQDYDRRNKSGEDEQSTPAEMLEYLMEDRGKSRKDMEAIFGTRSHVSEALSGKRSISAAQARKLGEMFGLPPGTFIR
jgi:HTH-type transcriptional regulator/antitoxin HigA